MRLSKLLLLVSGIGVCLFANATDTASQQASDLALNEPFFGWFFDVLQDMLASPCTPELSQDPLGNAWKTCVDDDASDDISDPVIQPRAPLVVPASDGPYPDEQRRLMGELADYFKLHPSLDPWRSQGGYAHVMAPFLNPYDALDEPCWGSVLTAPVETLSLAGFPGFDRRQPILSAHRAGDYLFTLPVSVTRGQAVTSIELYAPGGTATATKTGTAVLHIKETNPPRWALTLDNGIGDRGTISARVEADKKSQLCFETFFDASGHSTTVTQTWHPAVTTATRTKRDAEDAEARKHRSGLTVGQTMTRVAMLGHVPVTEAITVTSSKPIRMSGRFYNDVEGLTGSVFKTSKSHKHTLTEEILTYAWHGTSTQYTIHHPVPTANKRSEEEVVDVDAPTKGQVLSTVGYDALFYPATTSMTVFASKPVRASGFISNDLGYNEELTMTWKTKHHTVTLIRTVIISGRTFSTEFILPTPTASNIADVDNYSKGQEFAINDMYAGGHMVNMIMTVTETKPPRLSGHIVDDQKHHHTVFVSFKYHDHTRTARVDTFVTAGQTSSTTVSFPLSKIIKRAEETMEPVTVTVLDMQPGLSTLNHAANGAIAAGTVTVVDLFNREVFGTLVATTDNQGRPIMQTVPPKATTTTVTSWKKGQRTINKTITQTITKTKTKEGRRGLVQMSTATAMVTQTVTLTAGGGAPLGGLLPKGTTQFAVSGLDLPTFTTTIGGVLTLTKGFPIPSICGSSSLASHIPANGTSPNEVTLRDLREMYPDLDWNVLRIVAEQASHINPGHSVEQYMAAGAHCLLAHPGAGHAFHPEYTPAPIVRNISDIVKPTCDPHKDKTDKKQCSIDHCVWKHKRPMQFLTVFNAWVIEHDSYTMADYFTHTTTITDHPHWGSTKSDGTYYPLMITSTIVPGVGTTSTFATRQTPASVAKQHGVHGAPECFDKQTCYDQCYRAVHSGKYGDKYRKPLLITGSVLGGLVAAMALLCCCLPVLRRRRQQPTQQINRTPTAIREPANATVTRVIDPATGAQTVVVAPATAATGAVVGSTVAAEKAEKAAGQGTLGRQAEEGRGHVSFTPETDHAAEKVVKAPAAAQHVEAVPPQHDGADSCPTGVDVGSLRGRRRNRPQDLL